METRVAKLEEKLDGIASDTSRIRLILEGNGHCGVVTKTALNSQAITRLWWFIGIFCGSLSCGILALLWKASCLMAQIDR